MPPMAAMEVDNFSEETPKEASILVTVRVRPFNSTELALLGNDSSTTRPDYGSSVTAGQALRKIVHVLDSQMLVFDRPPDDDDDDEPRNHNGLNRYQQALLNRESAKNFRRYKDVKYTFDRVFGKEASQEEVHENTTKGLIDGVLNGYNATVFAYGATGCGKTHTISGTPTDPGIIFLTVRELFDRIHELESEKTVQMSLSYLEVYNEQIRDLLVRPTEGMKPKILQLREDGEKRIVVAGLTELHPKDVDEVMRAILMGNSNRTISPTEANAVSSRSHAVLQINVRQRPRTANISAAYTLATLSLIDLAGSERAAATKNQGQRLLEGANINRSLLALGNCINALCDAKGTSHIPYRDSKLTRLLKFSLGGNCKTVMIVCVSPSSLHYEETHNTLKYANRAKNIKTHVTKNTLSVDRHVSQYVKIIQDLRAEVSELKRRLSGIQESGYQEVVGRKRATDRVVEEAVKKMRTSYDTSIQAEVESGGYATRLETMHMQIEGMQNWLEAFESTCARIGEDARSGVQGYRGRMDELLGELEVQRSIVAGQLDSARQTLAVHQTSVKKIGASVPRDAEQMKTFSIQLELAELKAENAKLRTQNAIQSKVVQEQVNLVKGFMGLNGVALAGLRGTIADIESKGGDGSGFLNDLYIGSITQFTEATKKSDALYGILPNPIPLERRLSLFGESVFSGKRAYPGGGPNGPSFTRTSSSNSVSKYPPSPRSRKVSNLSNTPKRPGLGSPRRASPRQKKTIVSSVTKQSNNRVPLSPRQFKARSPKKPVSIASRAMQSRSSALRNNIMDENGLSNTRNSRTRALTTTMTGSKATPKATPTAVQRRTSINDIATSLSLSANSSSKAQRKRPVEKTFAGSNGRLMTTVDEVTEPEESESSFSTGDKSFYVLGDLDSSMEQQHPQQEEVESNRNKSTRKAVVTFAAEPTYLGGDDISTYNGEEFDSASTRSSVPAIPQGPIVGILKGATRLDLNDGFSMDSPHDSNVGPIRIGTARRQVRRLSVSPLGTPSDTSKPLEKNQITTALRENFYDIDPMSDPSKVSVSNDLRRQTLSISEARRTNILSNWNGGSSTKSKLGGGALKVANAKDMLGNLGLGACRSLAGDKENIAKRNVWR